MTIKEIAYAIDSDWVKVSPHAKPYLDAMKEIETINESYYAESAESVVLYFLANAQTYRTPNAKNYKAQLKELLK